MPLEFERYDPEENRWTDRGEVKPDGCEVIIYLKSGGTAEMLSLECSPDDSQSSIKRQELGDKSFVKPGRMQVLHPEKDPVEIARLGRGESFYTTIQVIEKDSEPTRYRFTHR